MVVSNPGDRKSPIPGVTTYYCNWDDPPSRESFRHTIHGTTGIFTDAWMVDFYDKIGGVNVPLGCPRTGS